MRIQLKSVPQWATLIALLSRQYLVSNNPMARVSRRKEGRKEGRYWGERVEREERDRKGKRRTEASGERRRQMAPKKRRWRKETLELWQRCRWWSRAAFKSFTELCLPTLLVLYGPVTVTVTWSPHPHRTPTGYLEGIRFLESRWIEYPRSAHYRSELRFRINSAISLGQSLTFAYYIFRFYSSSKIRSTQVIEYHLQYICSTSHF